MTGAVGRLAIVADDLTGAADAAAPFASRGPEVSIVLRWPPADGVEVLVVVTDSRWLDEASAQARVVAGVGRARRWGAQRLFVKVDSTLRGNVSAEVAGALAAWGGGRALAAPAFPAQGRGVRQGVLYVHGMAQEAVAARFPPGVEVCDAETDAQLVRVAERVLRDGLVAVGSAGLARALASLEPTAAPLRRPSAAVTGVLVVVGTTHPVTQAQVAALLVADVLCVVVGAAMPADLGPAALALAAGGRVLVTTQVVEDVEADSPHAQALAAQLAGVVRGILARAPASALVLTGGATALAVAEVLGAQALRLLGEVEAGVALGELLLGHRRVATITKSGGFGDDNTLVRAVEFLEECA